MQVDLETLRTQILRVGIHRVMDSAEEHAKVLADQLASFTGKYWYSWVNYGDGVFRASVQSSADLSLLVTDGRQIELQSGPLDSRDEAQTFMDAAVARDQKRMDEAGPYKPPPKGKVKWGSGGDGEDYTRPDSAIHVVDVLWGEMGDKNHTQRYHLALSPGKRLWVLWQEYVNSAKSVRPWVIAHMTKRGVKAELAAQKLLTYALEEERDEDMRRFDGIAVIGCMPVADVERIASQVWEGK